MLIQIRVDARWRLPGACRQLRLHVLHQKEGYGWVGPLTCKARRQPTADEDQAFVAVLFCRRLQRKYTLYRTNIFWEYFRASRVSCNKLRIHSEHRRSSI